MLVVRLTFYSIALNITHHFYYLLVNTYPKMNVRLWYNTWSRDRCKSLHKVRVKSLGKSTRTNFFLYYIILLRNKITEIDESIQEPGGGGW